MTFGRSNITKRVRILKVHFGCVFKLEDYQSTLIYFMKTLRFVGSSLDDLKAFPPWVRRAAGFELDAVQRGFMPSDFKPMAAVGTGVYEIRIHAAGEWRIIYVAKRRETIFVLHAFQKKSRSTLREHIELARHRYKALEHMS